MLPEEALLDEPDLNFLTPAAHLHAKERAPAVRATGGTMETDRLFRNLLSSMPLCFNIFGSLGTHPAFGRLLRSLVDRDAEEAVEVQCEWAPQPPSEHLGDKSAFDALLRYGTGEARHASSASRRSTPRDSVKGSTSGRSTPR
jgi:hypothetical protein